MRYALLPLIALLLTGCVTTAVIATYDVATDARPVERQHLDTEIELTIKTRLLESDVRGIGWLSAYCRHGIVVLTGVVDPASPAAREAVAIAHRVEGVRRVETYFVPSRPSLLGDVVIRLKLHGRMFTDWSLRASQVSMAVLAGHVVLVGVVGEADKAKTIVDYARATDGVVAVRSFIQVALPERRHVESPRPHPAPRTPAARDRGRGSPGPSHPGEAS